MKDELSEVYGPFTRPCINDPDVTKTQDVVALLRTTYAGAVGIQELLFSDTRWRPSLVARSDAEIYDIDFPRWAKRAHVALETAGGQSYLGFINLRAERHLTRYQKIRVNRLAGSIMCGAHLRPPPRLEEEGYRFPVASEVALYWNELGGWKGTIFASPLASSGEGRCAAACAYMATYPMIRHGARILSVADLTFVASGLADQPHAASILVQGMSAGEMCELLYSRHVGCPAVRDKVSFRERAGGRQPVNPALLNRAMSVIVSYLDEGLPVICCLALYPLARDNEQYPKAVHDEFRRKRKYYESDRSRSYHVVVIVGYRPPGGGRDCYDLVYHDPTGGPYMTVPAEKLAEAASDATDPSAKATAFDLIIPVPHRVAVSLDGGYGCESQAPHVAAGPALSSLKWRGAIGRHELDVAAGKIPPAPSPLSANGAFSLRSPAAGGRFRLVRRQDFFHRYVSLNLAGKGARSAGEDRRTLLRWDEIERKLPETIWVEEFAWPGSQPDLPVFVDRAIGGFWGWSPLALPCRDGFRVPIMQCVDGNLSLDFRGVRRNIALRAGPLHVRKAFTLEVGAVTSFHVGPLREALEHMARYGVANVDLFAFQQEDLVRYYGAKPDASPLDVMSSRNADPASVAVRLAADVREVEARTGRGFRFHVRGFATYFPEISSLDDVPRKKARKALIHLMEVASLLRKLYGIEPRFVEAVAGAILKGKLVPGNRQANRADQWVLEKADEGSKFTALAQSLKELSVAAEDNDLYLSLEIEPGALPLLNSLDRLKKLVDILNDRRREIRYPHRIGINVDIAHMWLCGITPDDLRPPHMRRRIAHVHIGDIGPGHMSDLVTGTVHTPGDYAEWIRLFRDTALDLPRDSRRWPEFSCCLSVELEACRGPSMLAAAYHRTRMLLDRYQS